MVLSGRVVLKGGRRGVAVGLLLVKLGGVMVGDLKRALTGVKSLLSSSVADAAASMRSCHLLSYSAVPACGSADIALRS